MRRKKTKKRSNVYYNAHPKVTTEGEKEKFLKKKTYKE